MGDFLSDLTVFQKVFFVISASSTAILAIQTIMAIVGIAGNSDSELGESHIPGGEHDVADFDAVGETDLDSLDSADSMDTTDSTDSTDDFGGDAQEVDGLRLFTVRGIMAFLMLGGWVGFLFSRAGISEAISLICALASGVAALVLIAKLMQALMRLQEDGTTKVKNALGQIGQVYIRIPAEEKGKGKVNVTVQEKLCEFEAVTEKGETIKTGELVYVTDIRPGNVLVVEKAEEST